MKKIILLLALSVISGLVCAQTAFGPEQVITTNADGAQSVFAADLDNDGFADVLSASSGDDKIAWYKNNGDGTFGSQQIITTNAQGAHSVFAADLDNDGDIDVLSASWFDSKIAWYKNNGDGTFASQQIITTNAQWANSVYASDLDNDSYIDVLSASGSDNKIAWYKNNGNGTFGSQQIISTNAQDPWSVYAADLDNDGYMDVLSASVIDNKIAWYKNNGNGTFGFQQIITNNANNAWSVYAADLDNDGYFDVLSASSGDNKIAWYKNNGNGTFGNQQIITINADVAKMVYAADLDNDGNVDVLSASEEDKKIAWYKNNGDGTFESQQIITTNAQGAQSVFAADLNNDGDMDVLSADDKIVWYENHFIDYYFFQYDICEGDSIFTLGQWLFEPDIYIDTLTNFFGGDSIVTLTLTNLPIPEDYIIIGPLQVEKFSVQTYSVPANSAVEYTFEVENGNILSTQSNSVEVQWGEDTPGTIIATATFPLTGCHTESTLEVTVGTGGIDESLASKVKLYPNPAEDVLYLESILPDLKVEISDPAGKTVLQSINPVIDISSLKQGIYIVKVLDKKEIVVKSEKLIVK